MRIITRSTLYGYAKKHPDAHDSINGWANVVKNAKCNNYDDFRKLRAGMEYVGNKRFVCNIKNGYYRLIVAIIPKRLHKVYIRKFLTHTEYSRLSKKDIMEM